MEDANTAAITSNGVNTDYQVVKRSLSFVKKCIGQKSKDNGENQLYIKLLLPRVQPNLKVHEWIA